MRGGPTIWLSQSEDHEGIQFTEECIKCGYDYCGECEPAHEDDYSEYDEPWRE